MKQEVNSIDTFIDELWDIYDSNRNPVYEYNEEPIEAKTIKLYSNLELVGVEDVNKKYTLFGITTDRSNVKYIHPIIGNNIEEVFEASKSEPVFKEHLNKIPKLIVSSAQNKTGSTVKLKTGEYATITQSGEILKK